MNTVDVLRQGLVNLLESGVGAGNSAGIVSDFEDAVRADERDKWADPEHDTDEPKYDINVQEHPPHCGCLPGRQGEVAGRAEFLRHERELRESS